VQFFPGFRVEIGVFVCEAKLLGAEVKVRLRKVNEETLDTRIEKIRAGGEDQDKTNQVSPVDRHEQHLPERIFFSHGPIIADPYLSIKRI
jgi:UDP-N-acetylglucosamine enolpyruvyl transferase